MDHDYEGPAFPARDAAGWRYTLIPMYRLKPTRHGWERDTSPQYLAGLRTEHGKRVEWVGPGTYRIVGGDPSTVLTSEHPDAV